MARLTITIDLDNAAFSGYHDEEEPIAHTAVGEVGRLLTNYVQAIESAGYITNPLLVDHNGNRVGTVNLEAAA